MTNSVWVGLALGTSFGVGLWLIMLSLPRFRTRSVYDRVALLVADVSPAAYDEVINRGLGRSRPHGLAAVTKAIAHAATRFGGPTNTLEKELYQAGTGQSVSEFRTAQASWTLWAGIAGAVIAGALALVVPVTPASFIVLPLAGAALGFLGVRYLLTRAARSRVKAIDIQLPAIWEFLSLSIAAGESLPDALHRVSAIGHGECVGELRKVMNAVEVGVPLATALEAMSRSLAIPSLSRGIEQILSALHRGTPLVGVLQAHALDAREDAKRRLLESAGQKEVLMLVPLVFLILPVTIAFAVFPGLLVIQTGLS